MYITHINTWSRTLSKQSHSSLQSLSIACCQANVGADPRNSFFVYLIKYVAPTDVLPQSKTGIIAGVVCGLVALIVCVVLICVAWRYYHRREKTAQQTDQRDSLVYENTTNTVTDADADTSGHSVNFRDKKRSTNDVVWGPVKRLTFTRPGELKPE